MLEKESFGARPLIWAVRIITAIAQPTDCCVKRLGTGREYFLALEVNSHIIFIKDGELANQTMQKITSIAFWSM
jgi:hypothetical protein